MAPKVCFLGAVRRRTMICCRNVKISASSAARDRNRSTTAQTMSLKRYLITDQHRPILGQPPVNRFATGTTARIPDLVRLSGINLEVITQRSQKTHEPLELNLGESSSQDFRQLGLGGSNPPRGDARWPRDDWPTKSAHCRGLPTGVSLSQTAIALIVRRRRELLPVCGLPIAMEEPPCPSPRPCKSTWIRPSHTK